ncbi:MAG: response regulator [Burkholderiales bacterium]
MAALSLSGLRLLFERARVDVVAHIVAAAIAVGSVATRLPTVSVAGWACGLLSALGLRYLVARTFIKSGPSAYPWAWEGAAGLISFIVGLMWGVLALVQNQVPLYAQNTLIVATAAVSAIGLWSLASSRSTFPAFMLGLLIPWALCLATADTPLSAVAVAFAALSVIYLGLFVFIHRQADELLRLRPEYAAMVRQTAVPQHDAKPNVAARQAGEPSLLTFMTTLGEREQRPYAGVRRRASDFRDRTNPPVAPKSSSFGQIKIHDVISEPPPDPASVSILLVEDNIDNQLVALHLLEKRGYKVVIANNGREALAAVERQRFQLILMDLQMPEMSGLEVTAAIRLREKTSAKRIPIVALTANTASESREICLAAGMDDFLSKPINRTRLYASIDAQLAKKRVN